MVDSIGCPRGFHPVGDTPLCEPNKSESEDYAEGYAKGKAKALTDGFNHGEARGKFESKNKMPYNLTTKPPIVIPYSVPPFDSEPYYVGVADGFREAYVEAYNNGYKQGYIIPNSIVMPSPDSVKVGDVTVYPIILTFYKNGDWILKATFSSDAFIVGDRVGVEFILGDNKFTGSVEDYVSVDEIDPVSASETDQWISDNWLEVIISKVRYRVWGKGGEMEILGKIYDELVSDDSSDG